MTSEPIDPRERMAGHRRIAHPTDMAKRSVKSLHRTGRVSRKKARVVAKRLLAELDSGAIRQIPGKRIRNSTTASGRGAIAFHVVSPGLGSASKRRPARRAARKAAR